jgi:hypothetical protein
MSGPLTMEALARVEHKLDLIMHKLGIVVTPPMSFIGVHRCPACGMAIEYKIDFVHNVVKRVCGCSTGKQPFTADPYSPTTPQPQGVKNDGSPESDPEPAPGAEHGRRR